MPGEAILGCFCLAMGACGTQSWRVHFLSYIQGLFSPSFSTSVTSWSGKGPSGPSGQPIFHSAQIAGWCQKGQVNNSAAQRREPGAGGTLHCGLLAMLDGSALPEALPPCMLGLGITSFALILGPDCSQNQAMEDLLKYTLHQSQWGLWSHPPLPCPLGSV